MLLTYISNKVEYIVPTVNYLIFFFTISYAVSYINAKIKSGSL